jgi:hypothetical protein
MDVVQINLSETVARRCAVRLPGLICLVGFILLRGPLTPTCHAQEGGPRLRPPKAELPETAWEKHRTFYIFGAAAAVLFLGAAAFYLLRPKPATPIPPERKAQLRLDQLRDSGIEERVLAEVPRILKEFFLEYFGFPLAEVTTDELSRTLRSRPGLPVEVTGRVESFLRGIDERRFSGNASIERASRLIEDAVAIIQEGARPTR